MLRGLASIAFVGVIGLTVGCRPASSQPPSSVPATNAPVFGPAADASAFAAPPPATEIAICAWNVRKLGHGDAKDHRAVAAILDEHCDFAVIVEVMQKQGGHPGYDALRAELGDAWQGAVTATPRPNTTSASAEFYAMVWRSERIAPCEPGSADVLTYVVDAETPEAPLEDRFRREPAYGCFRAARDDGGIGFDFVVAAFHATWDGGKMGSRRAEAEALRHVFPEVLRDHPDERDAFVLGDFNLSAEQLRESCGCDVQTIGAGSTLNQQGERTDNLYDHLVVFDASASQELVGPAEVLDVRGEEPSAFVRRVSDHLPIRARFRFHDDDD